MLFESSCWSVTGHQPSVQNMDNLSCLLMVRVDDLFHLSGRLASVGAEMVLKPLADAVHADAQSIWRNPQALGHLLAMADALAAFALVIIEDQFAALRRQLTEAGG